MYTNKYRTDTVKNRLDSLPHIPRAVKNMGKGEPESRLLTQHHHTIPE